MPNCPNRKSKESESKRKFLELLQRSGHIQKHIPNIPKYSPTKVRPAYFTQILFTFYWIAIFNIFC